MQRLTSSMVIRLAFFALFSRGHRTPEVFI